MRKDNFLKFNEEDIKKVKRSTELYFSNGVKVEMKEEVISSLEVDDYLNNFINDEDNDLQDKILMSLFLNDYLDQDLYAVEVIKDNVLYIRVENEDDEILSGELSIGEVVEETIEDYELIARTDMTINKYVDSILDDDSINSDDKLFMIRDLLKYLNKGLYRQDAEDRDGNMLQLVLDQQTDKIIDKIYY